MDGKKMVGAELSLEIIQDLRVMDDNYDKPLKNGHYVYLAGKHNLCRYFDVINITPKEWQLAKSLVYPEQAPFKEAKNEI